MSRTVRIFTPAKLNLGLKIGRKLASGFHGLETVFQVVKIVDQLVITRKDSDGRKDILTVSGPVSVPDGPENLIFKTLQFLRDRGVEIPPLKVQLKKRIPTGAGLGGGSGNAAGLILWAVQNFSGIKLDWSFYSDVAHKLGADIPFFLTGETCRAAGIGEQLLSLPPQEGWALIAIPGLHISTVSAYSQFEKEVAETKNYCFNLPVLPVSRPGYLWQKLNLENDFWPVLVSRYEQLEEIRERLGVFSNYVGLTGSGSGLYALFERREKANEAVKQLRNNNSAIDWFMGRLGGTIEIGAD